MEYVFLKSLNFKKTIYDTLLTFFDIRQNITSLSKEINNFDKIIDLSETLTIKTIENKSLNINEYKEFLESVYTLQKGTKYKNKPDALFFFKFVVCSPVNIYIFIFYYKKLKIKNYLLSFKDRYLLDIIKVLDNKKIKKFYKNIFGLYRFKEY